MGWVLTHLGAQLGDVATTLADNGSSNLRSFFVLIIIIKKI